MPIPSSVVPDDNRDSFLSRLEVTVEQLLEVITTGYIHKSTATASEPAGAGSYYVYSKGTGQLRDTLAPFKWARSAERNFERTLRADRRVAIALSSGNSAVGLADATPHTRNPKGPTMQAAVEQNLQLVLFDPITLQPTNGEERSEVECETWLLLHFQDPQSNEIRVELSLPTEMNGRHISSWRHRILLPSLRTETSFDIAGSQAGRFAARDEPDDEINVDVRPRGSR